MILIMAAAPVDKDSIVSFETFINFIPAKE